MKHCYTVLGVILLLVAFPCVEARDVCYTIGSTEYYCVDDYYCCDGNTRCFAEESSVGLGIIVGAVIGGIVVLVVVIVVCVQVCNRMNKPKVVVQPVQGQGISTVSTTQQQQPMYNSGAFQGNNTYPPPITTGPYQSNSTHPPPITTGAYQNNITYPPPVTTEAYQSSSTYPPPIPTEAYPISSMKLPPIPNPPDYEQ